MLMRHRVRLLMSDDDSRRIIELFGPALAREEAARRQRLRIRFGTMALLAAIIVLVAVWLRG